MAKKMRKSRDSDKQDSDAMGGQVLEESEGAAKAGLGMENEIPAAVEETAEMVTLPAADLEKLKADKDEYYDRLLRLGAEFENYKKRVQKEFDSFRKYAAEDVVLELLPVLDSFERALSNLPEGVNDGFREGIEIIHRQLSEALEKIGLVPMDVVGKKFDPNIHDALTGVHSEEHDEGTVVEEFLKGYTLFDKVVRHAKVSVSSCQGEDEDDRN